MRKDKTEPIQATGQEQTRKLIRMNEKRQDRRMKEHENRTSNAKKQATGQEWTGKNQNRQGETKDDEER